MSGDWNLKNDCLVIIDKRGNRGYYKPGIKTLRKKLIENLNENRKDMKKFCGYDNGMVEYDFVISIINKCFGVKHNAKSKKR